MSGSRARVFADTLPIPTRRLGIGVFVRVIARILILLLALTGIGFWLFSVSPTYTEEDLHSARAERDWEAVRMASSDLIDREGETSRRLLFLGVAQRHLGSPEAVDTLERAMQSNPRDVEVHYELGVALLKSNDAASAALELTSVLRKNPHHRQAYLQLAQCYFRQNLRQEGQVFLRRARALEAADGEEKVGEQHEKADQAVIAIRYRARAERKRGEFEQAEKLLRSALEKEPIGARIFLIEHLVESHAFHRARQEIFELEKLVDARHPDLIGWSAVVHGADPRRRQKAAHDLVQLMNRDPNLVPVWGIRLLDLLELLLAHEIHIEWADICLRHDPSSIAVLTRKARVLNKLGRIDAAIDTLDITLLNSPAAEEEGTHLVLALSLLREGETSRSLAILESTPERWREDPRYRSLLESVRNNAAPPKDRGAEIEDVLSDAALAESDEAAAASIDKAVSLAHESGQGRRAKDLARIATYLTPDNATRWRRLVALTTDPEEVFLRYAAEERAKRIEEQQ